MPVWLGILPLTTMTSTAEAGVSIALDQSSAVYYFTKHRLVNNANASCREDRQHSETFQFAAASP